MPVQRFEAGTTLSVVRWRSGAGDKVIIFLCDVINCYIKAALVICRGYVPGISQD